MFSAVSLCNFNKPSFIFCLRPFTFATMKSNHMKKIIPVFVFTLLLATTITAQNQFEVLVERPNEKSLKGIISRQILESDTSFKWYAENLKGYTPNAKAVEGLKKNADSIQLLV